jgi:hypothetical protein
MKSADSLASLVLITALGTIPCVSFAQTATATDTSTLTRGGTGTLTRGGTGTGAVVDDRDTLTRAGTGTGAALMSASPWTLAATESSVTGPGTNTISVDIAADPTSTSTATTIYTVPLSSSDAACSVPGSVKVAWTASAGGHASFKADCAAVPTTLTVTITGGTATADFELQASQSSAN